ncbi:MAG TPA: CYTH domain-containing protein [Pricia sp.]|nr:CYTH domain-containing protein [Pricia sp.]
MIEIERKFLIKSTDYRKEAITKERIVQGFLNTDPQRTVRVRIKGDTGYLTVKGPSNAAGTSRFEWEQKIVLKEAEILLGFCEETLLEKQRFNIPVGKYRFEVDEFQGENEGLILAEIELQSENQAFPKPAWLGEEVTGQIKYYNSQLSKKPYKSWKR